ncbi:MAG: WYL domain-containing transcriptional regulator [Dorea sp.]|nr:WYL domain-containing transcriptional regulator [Dorea sp.]
MAVSSVKLRTLYIMRILLEKTDERHFMSAADIGKALAEYGMSADRKTVYGDIETLNEFGMDILQAKGTNGGYYIGRRDFELPELKLLVDAVQASKFISRKKSEELIKKLESLASEHDARQLQRNVFIYNRPKTGNETIYYNVDQIHAAILDNRQIRYQYAEWTVNKKLRPKKGGEFYTVSPWALTWDDANYYLIAYDKEADFIKHYRVDKMQQAHVTDAERVGKERFQNFDLAEFAKKTFSMYGGRDEEVTLVCENGAAGVILDRFGKEVSIIPIDKEHFRVRILAAVSPQFFGWVTGIGGKIRIAAPLSVQKEYREYLMNIIKKYTM